MPYYKTYVPDALVEHNIFLKRQPENTPLPKFDEVRSLLPEPFWAGHQAAIDCYWKVWQIAFKNLMQPAPGSGFISNFIDTAFNGCLFMWDSAFITLFASYGRRAFDFQKTLDNFYAKQHPDGFICREIAEDDGEDRFFRFDPTSTGPNLLPWSEWENFLRCGDRQRLAAIFPPLVALYHWFRTYRTWRDGTYWASGWACGMDNQPRLDEKKYHVAFSNGHMVWVDTCLQQIFVNRILQQMAGLLGREADVADFEDEVKRLESFIQERLWDDKTAYYYDLDSADRLVPVKSIGAYWALLAGIVPQERLERFIDHLSQPAEFNRPHRVPTLSADHPLYEATGGYWRGAVWAPTNYMILRGLTAYHQDDLAYEIALNHLDNVVRLYQQTGTVWENMAPESVAPGQPAKPDFVGWGGVPPVAVFLEYVLGLRPDMVQRKLVWDIRLLEEHGVKNYPFGSDGVLDLHCAARQAADEKPHITVKANIPLTLEMCWGKNSDLLSF